MNAFRYGPPFPSVRRHPSIRPAIHPDYSGLNGRLLGAGIGPTLRQAQDMAQGGRWGCGAKGREKEL